MGCTGGSGLAPVYNTKITTDNKELRQAVNQHTSQKFKAFEAFLNAHFGRMSADYLQCLPRLTTMFNETNSMIASMDACQKQMEETISQIKSEVNNMRINFQHEFGTVQNEVNGLILEVKSKNGPNPYRPIIRNNNVPKKDGAATPLRNNVSSNNNNNNNGNTGINTVPGHNPSGFCNNPRRTI